jgi:hypothetical protein
MGLRQHALNFCTSAVTCQRSHTVFWSLGLALLRLCQGIDYVYELTMSQPILLLARVAVSAAEMCVRT